MNYLIDGYNVIFDCGLHGKHINGQTVAQARIRLLNEIAKHLPQSMHARVTVVFDASRRMIREKMGEEYFGEIRVLYSIKFDDADEMIEHLIGQASVPVKLMVVSSDHRLHKAALRRRAEPIDSGQWYDALIEGRLAQKHQDTDDLADGQAIDRKQPGERLLSSDELEQLKKDVDELEGS